MVSLGLNVLMVVVLMKVIGIIYGNSSSSNSTNFSHFNFFSPESWNWVNTSQSGKFLKTHPTSKYTKVEVNWVITFSDSGWKLRMHEHSTFLFPMLTSSTATIWYSTKTVMHNTSWTIWGNILQCINKWHWTFQEIHISLTANMSLSHFSIIFYASLRYCQSHQSC